MKCASFDLASSPCSSMLRKLWLYCLMDHEDETVVVIIYLQIIVEERRLGI